MFPVSTLIAFGLGIAVILSVPGPTNTLLAAAGAQQGVARSVRLTLVELAGYVIAVSVWGLCFTRVGDTMPWLSMTVRIASGLYIAWLAIRMWRATLAVFSSDRHAVRPFTLFIATLLNPKGILFGSTIFPAAAFATPACFIEAMTLFAALLVPIGTGWIALGAALGSGRLPWLDPVGVQRSASVVLAVFSLTIAWTAFH
ncbi:LysE family transporter [Paraburkholderia sp.]|uniref:LysE family translocator n=1 Tax=Paraburkholderia sp. TaxID=1926495 RepID=UPI002396CF00|nr:LysE family transporter [Paraburkholderia sp.]MDE1179118.1 LysE family transporter [Paraburkholderia sp.]